MKTVRSLPLNLALVLLAGVWPGAGTTLTWTNTSGGNWSVAANWSPNSVPASGDTVFITNSGTYTVTVNVSPTLAGLTLGGASGTQTLAIASTTLTLNGSSSAAANSVVQLNAGTIAGTGEFAVNGDLVWAGGYITSSGGVTASGTLRLTGSDKRLEGGGVLRNGGVATWEAGSLIVSVASSLTNLASGTFDLAHDATFGYYPGPGWIHNAGLWRKTAGSGVAVVQQPFHNTGTVEVQAGTMRLTQGGTSGGMFAPGSGGSLELAGGIFVLSESATVGGAGEWWCSGGTVTCRAEGGGTVTNRITGGTVYYEHGGGATMPNLVLAGGTLAGSGGVTVSGAMEWTGGYITSSGGVTANGTLRLTGSDKRLEGGGVLRNGGVATWEAGSLIVSVASSLTNLASGTFDVAHDAIFGYHPGPGWIHNAGLWRKTAGSGVAVVQQPFHNTGTVEVQAGTLRLNWSYTQAEGLTLLTNGDITTTYPLGIYGGVLAGNGTITGSVTNNGALCPGVSPGRLTITGDYTQTADGLMNVELAGTHPGTNYDRLVVNGTARLAGSVSVTLTNGFYPGTNALFPFLTAGTRSGTFANFFYPSNDVGLKTNYTATTAAAEVINVRPVLAAIPNATNDELVAFSHLATATDDDRPEQMLTFSLTNPPVGVAIHPATGQLTWMPTEAQGPLITNITVRVTDNGTPNLTVARTFEVVVNEINVPPVLTLPSDPAVSEETPYSAHATATDTDIPLNTPLTFELLSGPAGLTVAADGAIAWTPAEAQGSNVFSVTVRVTDTNEFAVNEKQLSMTNSFAITVHEVNRPPALAVPTNQVLTEETLLAVAATGTDPDLPPNPLTYELVSPPAGAAIDAGTGAITWTPTEAQGSNVFTLTVHVKDLSPLAVNQQQFSITNSFQVTVHESNRPPVLTVPGGQMLDELTPLAVSASATDPDLPANELTYALLAPPEGMTIHPGSGALAWTPTEAQGSNTYTITVTVTDTNAAAIHEKQLTMTNTFEIVVNEVNVAPVLDAIADQQVNPGQVVSFTAVASDADLPANALTFALLSAPPGAALDQTSGAFAWRPAVAAADTTNQIRVQVTDNGSPKFDAEQEFTVIVLPLADVWLTPLVAAEDRFVFQMTGQAGPDYTVLVTTNLGAPDWAAVATTNLAASPALVTNTFPSGSAAQRFYRVRIGP